MSTAAPLLLQGPYFAPEVNVGDRITCAIRGAVEVRGWHDKGSVPVPLGGVKGTRWSMVVSHDLLRALSIETSLAICWHWAVSHTSVLTWRKALGIDGRNAEGFLHAMSKVGSVTGNASGVADHLRMLNARPWTTEELELLPQCSTLALVERTGRTREAIEHARVRYRLPQLRVALHCEHCGHSWLPHHNATPKRCPRHNCRQPLTRG